MSSARGMGKDCSLGDRGRGSQGALRLPGALALGIALAALPRTASADAGTVPALPAEPSMAVTSIHPVDYSLDGLRPFSWGLAAVRRGGKWGYVDRAGAVVVPFLYDEATPFDEGWAAVRRNGRWGAVDSRGRETAFPRPLARMGRYSEGLAAARATARGRWGYVDRAGAFVIAPQFDAAEPFSHGLAAVSTAGTWSYVTPRGTLAFATRYHKAFPFGEDGLALVQQTRHGPYGYIRADGSLAIAPRYGEAREFSQGLAPVRIGDRWGYVDASGTVAIPPAFSEAFPFSEGRALVMEGRASFFLIDRSGRKTHGTPFLQASPLSEGISIVGDGKGFWYVDTALNRLPIPKATPPKDAGSGCSPNSDQGVSTSYQGGLTFFQIANQTDLQWQVRGTDTWAQNNPQPGAGSGMDVNPGLPALVDAGKGPKRGQYGFLHQYNSFHGNPSGTYPLFDVTLTAGPYTITLSNAVAYTQPPPPKGHPWFEYLAYAIEALDGMFLAATGDPEAWGEIALGVYDMLNASYDIADGTVDDSGNDNENESTDNVLVTSLTVTQQGVEGNLQPLNGSFCGGDAYTVSDGSRYVFSLTTVKSAKMPPTVQLNITPWSAYFAQNALGRLQAFRGGSYGGPALTAPPFSCIGAIAFDDYGTATDNKPCSRPSLYPGYDYFTKAMSLDSQTALAWWSFANNLNELALDADTVTRWVRLFGGACGTLPTQCPSPTVPPVVISPASCSGATESDFCNCTFQVKNPNGPLHQTGATQFPWVTDCPTEAPFSPATCSFTLTVPAGTTGATVTVSDNLTEVPIPVTCTANSMVVTPTDLTGDNEGTFPGPCAYTVTVAKPRGKVTVTPDTFVKSNRCFAATEGSCSIDFGVPTGTRPGATYLADGVTTQPVRVGCSMASFSATTMAETYYTSPGYGHCVVPVPIRWAQGSVSVGAPHQSWVDPASSSCTGPMASCTMTFDVPVGTDPPVTALFTDGFSTDGAGLGCAACSQMVLPWGPQYATSAALGYRNGVLVQCYQPPVSVVAAPVGSSVDLSGCAQDAGQGCTAAVYSPTGGSFTLRDSRGAQQTFTVTVAK